VFLVESCVHIRYNHVSVLISNTLTLRVFRVKNKLSVIKLFRNNNKSLGKRDSSFVFLIESCVYILYIHASVLIPNTLNLIILELKISS
jgi:hypothetical protein